MLSISQIRKGSIIKVYGKLYKITNVFFKNESVHALGFWDDGSIKSQKHVQGFTFKTLFEKAEIVTR